MNPSRINININVIIGMDVVPAEEKENVLKAINSLENFSTEPPLDSKIKKFTPADIQPFYLLQATPNYLIIFEMRDGDEIEVIDLFRKERLEYFASLKKSEVVAQ